ncbi:tRNA guanosine(34) transglycosylase Tgt, partial [Tropheryma whipplei]|uniref:tRNA guanosine(34) transglycosylase Tgt n=1 Tax=Tropheryma whipplei TaxID=2039 RepID=UPI0004B3675B
MKQLGAQGLLANAYHLYLRPGPDTIAAAGGLSRFMSWNGPTFTDSGGFQVMSLGRGGKKVISMEVPDNTWESNIRKANLIRIDDQGVWFRSHIDGSQHRFTPEESIRVQNKIGADIIFAFDQLTTLDDSRAAQEYALERTRLWAERCLNQHSKEDQALFAVIQGANYRDLREKACRDLGQMGFDGFGIGGALEKSRIREIITWCTRKLPEEKPRHLLGISEPNDLMNAIEAGIDTFDCVSPTRVARNTAFYTPSGRKNLRRKMYRNDFSPLVEGCACYACSNFTRAYIHHLFRAKEMCAATLTSIHNEYFIVSMVDGARKAIDEGYFREYKGKILREYYK